MDELTPLAGRARLLFHLQALSRLLLFWTPVCVVLAVLGAAGWSLLGAVVAAGLLWFSQFLLAIWYPSLSFDRWGYRLDEHELLIVRGVLLRRVTAIPTNRVQHVDTQQGPIEQWFGLARLHVHTASGLGGDGVVPGLQLSVAEQLRDRLVELGGAEADDGV